MRMRAADGAPSRRARGRGRVSAVLGFAFATVIAVTAVAVLSATTAHAISHDRLRRVKTNVQTKEKRAMKFGHIAGWLVTEQEWSCDVTTGPTTRDAFIAEVQACIASRKCASDWCFGVDTGTAAGWRLSPMSDVPSLIDDATSRSAKVFLRYCEGYKSGTQLIVSPESTCPPKTTPAKKPTPVPAKAPAKTTTPVPVAMESKIAAPAEVYYPYERNNPMKPSKAANFVPSRYGAFDCGTTVEKIYDFIHSKKELLEEATTRTKKVFDQTTQKTVETKEHADRVIGVARLNDHDKYIVAISGGFQHKKLTSLRQFAKQNDLDIVDAGLSYEPGSTDPIKRISESGIEESGDWKCAAQQLYQYTMNRQFSMTHRTKVLCVAEMFIDRPTAVLAPSCPTCLLHLAPLYGRVKTAQKGRVTISMEESLDALKPASSPNSPTAEKKTSTLTTPNGKGNGATPAVVTEAPPAAQSGLSSSAHVVAPPSVPLTSLPSSSAKKTAPTAAKKAGSNGATSVATEAPPAAHRAA